MRLCNVLLVLAGCSSQPGSHDASQVIHAPAGASWQKARLVHHMVERKMSSSDVIRITQPSLYDAEFILELDGKPFTLDEFASSSDAPAAEKAAFAARLGQSFELRAAPDGH